MNDRDEAFEVWSILCYLVTDVRFLFHVSPRILAARFASAILGECAWHFSCAYLANAFFQVWISITAYLHFMCQSSQDKRSLADRIGKWDFYRFRNYLVDINFTLQQQNSHQCLCVTIRCLRHFLYLLGVKLDFSYILSVRYSQTRTRLWVSLRSVWRIGIVNFGEFTTYLSCSYVTLLEKF